MHEVEFKGYFTVLSSETDEEARDIFKDYFSEEFPEIEVDSITNVTEIK